MSLLQDVSLKDSLHSLTIPRLSATESVVTVAAVGRLGIEQGRSTHAKICALSIQSCPCATLLSRDKDVFLPWSALVNAVRYVK